MLNFSALFVTLNSSEIKLINILILSVISIKTNIGRAVKYQIFTYITQMLIFKRNWREQNVLHTSNNIYMFKNNPKIDINKYYVIICRKIACDNNKYDNYRQSSKYRNNSSFQMLIMLREIAPIACIMIIWLKQDEFWRVPSWFRGLKIMPLIL